MSSDDRETTEDGCTELDSLRNTAGADRAVDAGIAAGVAFAVGFLAGVGSAFTDHGKADLARAFTAAAGELGRVTPETVRADWPEHE